MQAILVNLNLCFTQGFRKLGHYSSWTKYVEHIDQRGNKQYTEPRAMWNGANEYRMMKATWRPIDDTGKATGPNNPRTAHIGLPSVHEEL